VQQKLPALFTQLRGMYVPSETKAEGKAYVTANRAQAVQEAQMPSTQKNFYNSTERQIKNSLRQH